MHVLSNIFLLQKSDLIHLLHQSKSLPYRIRLAKSILSSLQFANLDIKKG